MKEELLKQIVIVVKIVNDMKEDEIKEIMQTGECMTLECKRAKSEVPKIS